MSKRVLALGAVAVVLTTALMVNFFVLDLISARDLGETLGKTLLVVAVSTVAIVLTILIVRTGRRAQEHEQSSKN